MGWWVNVRVTGWVRVDKWVSVRVSGLVDERVGGLVGKCESDCVSGWVVEWMVGCM